MNIVFHIKGPSINYVVLVGGGDSPTDNLLQIPYFIKKRVGERVKKSPILKRRSLGTTLNRDSSPRDLYIMTLSTTNMFISFSKTYIT